MSKPVKSTLVTSTSLTTSLLILNMLQHKLRFDEERYGHTVEAYYFDDEMNIAQGGSDTSRVIAITFPNRIRGQISIEFGIVRAFDNMADLDIDPQPVTLFDALSMCNVFDEHTNVKHVDFDFEDLASLVNFIFKWLFPETPAHP